MKTKKPKIEVLTVWRVQCGVLYSELKAELLVDGKPQTATWLWCDAPEHLKQMCLKLDANKGAV
jgi:hypothetical protein